MSAHTTEVAGGAAPAIGFFERYLTVWVALCIVAGIVLGRAFPDMFAAIAGMEVAKVNLPVGVLIWCMVLPMLIKIDFAALGQVKSHWRGIGVTLFVNWLVKPFSMALLGWIFIRHVFADMLPADQHDQVVQRNLNERVGGIAIGQVRPDEHHRCAGRCREDDGTGKVLIREIRAYERLKKNAEKQVADRRHRKRLHQPVHEQRDEYSARSFTNGDDAAEIDLQHHRIHHEPDQHCDRNVDL